MPTLGLPPFSRRSLVGGPTKKKTKAPLELFYYAFYGYKRACAVNA